MINKSEQEFLNSVVFNKFPMEKNFEIVMEDKPDVYAKYDGEVLKLGAVEKVAYTRALALSIREIVDGKKDFLIEQKKNFDTCGAAIDMSRNAVMRPESVKKYLDILAMYGIDTFLMYMEDVYELEGYPLFGYQRGRYSVEQLQDIDAYAKKLGIEVIPSIQTLGHMKQFLKWPESASYRDNDSILLCGSEKTYELINDMICTMRKAFSSSRIFVGLDEALGMGEYEYNRRNGYRRRIDIFSEHVEKIKELCSNHNFDVIMCSDMYFKMHSKVAGDYGQNVSIPQETIDMVPDVTLMYWDYCGFNPEHYIEIMKEHKRFGKKLAFMGGNWTWLEALPDFDLTLKTAIPAMQACLEEKFETVFVSAWGDDGAVTDYFSAVYQWAILAEHCYLGKDCTDDDIRKMGEFISGATYEEMMALSQYTQPRGAGKVFLYGDMMLNLTYNYKLIPEQLDIFRGGLDVLKKSQNQNPFWKLYFEYAKLIYEICISKGETILEISKQYKAGNIAYFDKISKEDIPNIIDLYNKLIVVHQKLWMNNYRVYGWEVLSGRYGWIIERLRYLKDVSARYASGEIVSIEELEGEFVDREYYRETTFQKCSSPSCII